MGIFLRVWLCGRVAQLAPLVDDIGSPAHRTWKGILRQRTDTRVELCEVVTNGWEAKEFRSSFSKPPEASITPVSSGTTGYRGSDSIATSLSSSTYGVFRVGFPNQQLIQSGLEAPSGLPQGWGSLQLSRDDPVQLRSHRHSQQTQPALKQCHRNSSSRSTAMSPVHVGPQCTCPTPGL